MKKKQRSRLSNQLRQLSSLLAGGLAPSSAIQVAEVDGVITGAKRGARALAPKVEAIESTLADQLPPLFAKTRARLTDAPAHDQAALLGGISDLIDPSTAESPALGLVTANLLLLTFVSLMFGLAVAPQFEELFSAFGAALPGPTLVALVLLRWVLLPASVLVILWAITYSVWQSRPLFLGALTPKLDSLARRVPLIGRVGLVMETRRVAAWLAVSGVGPNAGQNLGCMAELVHSSVLARRVERVAKRIASGVSLPEAFRTSDWLPGLAKVLEENPNDPTALKTYANSLQISFDGELDRFVWTVQVISGVIVGFMVVAMYLPIFKMGSVV